MEDKQNGRGRRVSMLVSLFLFLLVRVWSWLKEEGGNCQRYIWEQICRFLFCICLTNELIIIITIQMEDFFKFVMNILGRIC
jgi:membrane-anchored protein YejM (alkaline phosphatase superfamily)